MVTMITLFGKELREMDYKQLEREWRSQKFILHVLRAQRTQLQKSLDKRIAQEESGEKRKVSKRIMEDKLSLVEIYIAHLEPFLEELEYVMSKRKEPLWNDSGSKYVRDIKARNIKARKKAISENASLTDWKKTLAKDTFAVSWDRDKFLQIAKDRGYQTEIALIHDVGTELKLTRAKAELILNVGRFSWGQVLCLGAMLQMTPKEFCDTFLAGYFVEQPDEEFRADYKNISRTELLKRTVKPEAAPKEPEEEVCEEAYEEVYVDASGKPEDEEWWFE